MVGRRKEIHPAMRWRLFNRIITAGACQVFVKKGSVAYHPKLKVSQVASQPERLFDLSYSLDFVSLQKNFKILERAAVRLH
jgi:hypothetical protein